jgi:pyruvate,water dikinase
MSVVNLVYNLNQLSENLTGEVGFKSLDLLKLSDFGIPTPNSFVITTSAVKIFFDSIDLTNIWQSHIKGGSFRSKDDFKKVSAHIQKKILDSKLPSEVAKQVDRFYSSLSGFSDAFVHIEIAESSLNRKEEKGEYSYLSLSNVRSSKELHLGILKLLASVFEPEYLYYLKLRDISPLTLNLPILVQKMIQPEISGNLFTINPYDNDESKVVIEAILGLHEPLVRNELIPDTYILNKKTGLIDDKKLVAQEWMMIRKGSSDKGESPNFKVNISKTWQSRQKLEDKYIAHLKKLSDTLEKAYNFPVVATWYYEGGKIYIFGIDRIQNLLTEEDKIEFEATPVKITDEVEKVLKVKGDIEIVKREKEVEDIKLTVDESSLLLTGETVASGVAEGEVLILLGEEDMRDVEKGKILVLESALSNVDHHIKECSGVIIDNGSDVNEISLLCKDYGIPCIVGTSIASKILRSGEKVVMDGRTGKIYEIRSNKIEKEIVAEIPKIVEEEIKIEDIPVKKIEIEVKRAEVKVEVVDTATSVMLSITDPSSLSVDEVVNTDGIGVMRAEYLLSKFGTNMSEILKSKDLKKQLTQSIYTSLYKASSAYSPKVVIYRLADFKSDQIDEAIKENILPMGVRGAYSLLHMNDLLEIELEAIRRVRNIDNNKNVWISIPYIRSINELKEIKQRITDYGFKRSSSFKVYANIETPAMYMNLDKVLDADIDGIIVDTNDLLPLLLGSDYSSMSFKSYKMEDSGIHEILDNIVAKCNKYKVPVILTGKLIEDNLSELSIRKIVESGITAVSVSRDKVNDVKKLIAKAEANLLANKAGVKRKPKISLPKKKTVKK